jgi:hypothetical protein
MLVQTNMGPLPYEAIVAQINARYAEGKTPDLAVKSALQLGIDPAIIATLPGVDENAMRRGMQLISSGAFEESATGTQADIQTAAPIGSAQYNARKAAGLDAFGFPPEEVAQLIAAGLYGPGRQFDPGDMAQPAQNFSGLFSSGNVLEDQAQQVLAASGKANDPRFADAIVGSFVQDGVTYNVQGDGSIQGIIETPTGAYLAGGFTPTGQQATEQLSTRFEETDLDRALGVLANAAIAAGTGLALGPAGVGALGVPGAAAAGAGLTNLVNTADLESALRAAALGGATAFGVQSLFPGAGVTAPVDDFLAADVAQLAAQGIPEDQIAQILTQEGVSSNVISAALDAQFGTSAPGSAKGLGTPSTPSGAEQVAVTGQNVSNLGALSSLAPALATFAPTQTLPSIQVTGQTVKPDLTVPEAVSAALPVVSGGTVQQVGVTGQTIPKTEPVAPTAAAVGAIVPGIQPAVPSAAEQVQVTGKKETPANITVPTLSAALPAIPAAVTATLPKPTQPPAKKEDSLFTPSDILKLLTLLGGTAAAGGAGTGTVPVGSIPPSDARLGSTTPQFGDDYYAAVQRYYNAFMPETPRDVATPLRAWYENTGMSPAASGGTFAPGSVVGGLFGGRSTLPSGPTMRPQSSRINYEATQQNLLSSPQYGGQYYGAGLQRLGGLPAGLSNEALAKLFPQGTSPYIPQEVSVSIPDYFGYIVNNPDFDTLYNRANTAQRAFARSGANPAQLEYEMKNRLNNLAGGLPYTGGVDQGVKPLLPLLTAIDAAQGRLTSDQVDALNFIVNNAETYNRLKQDIPVWEKEGNTAYLEKQKPYFEQLGTALKDYQSKLSGLDPNTLSSKELFALFPNLG